MATTIDTTSIINLNQAFKEYKWYSSCNVPIELSLRFCRLEIPIDIQLSSEQIQRSELFEDLYINAQIISNSIILHEFIISAHYGTIDQINNLIIFDDVVSFPVKYKDLSQDALIAMTIRNNKNQLIGGTTLRLFNNKGCLKSGKQKLLFYFNQISDINVIAYDNKTPGDLYDTIYASYDSIFQSEKQLETYRSLHLPTATSAETGRPNANLDWLDRLTVERLESSLYHAQLSTSLTSSSAAASSYVASSTGALGQGLGQDQREVVWGRPAEEFDLKYMCFLIVELPVYPYPVSTTIYYIHSYPSIT